jgi:hypothetical protein
MGLVDQAGSGIGSIESVESIGNFFTLSKVEVVPSLVDAGIKSKQVVVGVSIIRSLEGQVVDKVVLAVGTSEEKFNFVDKSFVPLWEVHTEVAISVPVLISVQVVVIKHVLNLTVCTAE